MNRERTISYGFLTMQRALLALRSASFMYTKGKWVLMHHVLLLSL